MPALVQIEFAWDYLHSVHRVFVFAVNELNDDVGVWELIEIHQRRIHRATNDVSQKPKDRLLLFVGQLGECFAVRAVFFGYITPLADVRFFTLRISYQIAREVIPIVASSNAADSEHCLSNFRLCEVITRPTYCVDFVQVLAEKLVYGVGHAGNRWCPVATNTA
jgi:hypothetical protein